MTQLSGPLTQADKRYKTSDCVKYDVLMALSIKLMIPSEVTPYNLVERYQCFGGAYYLRLIS
jgi:hypothetical protein